MSVTFETLKDSESTKVVERPSRLLRRTEEVICWSFVFTCDNKACNDRQFIGRDLTIMEAIVRTRQHQCTATEVRDKHTKSRGKLMTWAQFRKAPSWHIHICVEHLCPPVPCAKLDNHEDIECEHGIMEIEDPY